MDDAKTLILVLLAVLLLGLVVLVAPECFNRRQTTITTPVGSTTEPTPKPPGDPRPSTGQGKDVTLMIVIPEICIRQRIPDPAAETAVIREFLLRNFRVVDQTQVARLRYNDQTLLAAQGDPEALKALQALAIQYDADVLVIGEAFGEGPVPGAPSGMQAVRARVELRAVMTRTGQIITAEAEHQGGADLTFGTACKMALQRAGEQIGKKLIPQFERRFGPQSAAQDRVELIVTSLPFSLYASFKNQIAMLPAVRSVIADHYNDKQSQVSVTYDGDLMDLVQQVTTLKLDGYHLEVLSYSSTRVSFKLVP